jgi:hypothetical protein
MPPHHLLVYDKWKKTKNLFCRGNGEFIPQSHFCTL